MGTPRKQQPRHDQSASLSKQPLHSLPRGRTRLLAAVQLPYVHCQTADATSNPSFLGMLKAVQRVLQAPIHGAQLQRRDCIYLCCRTSVCLLTMCTGGACPLAQKLLMNLQETAMHGKDISRTSACRSLQVYSRYLMLWVPSAHTCSYQADVLRISLQSARELSSAMHVKGLIFTGPNCGPRPAIRAPPSAVRPLRVQGTPAMHRRLHLQLIKLLPQHHPCLLHRKSCMLQLQPSDSSLRSC